MGRSIIYILFYSFLIFFTHYFHYYQNDEFGLNDINTRDFETGVDYHDNEKILPDRLTHIIPKGLFTIFPFSKINYINIIIIYIGSDHPTPFAQGCPDNTPGALYFPHDLPASLQNPASKTSEDYGAYPDPQLPPGWKSLGPQWGPLEMINELGCPPVLDENDPETFESRIEDPKNEETLNATEEVYNSKRRFDDSDFQLKFRPREEFGGPRKGFVFRMGAQGLGYYEDIHANDNIQNDDDNNNKNDNNNINDNSTESKTVESTNSS